MIKTYKKVITVLTIIFLLEVAFVLVSGNKKIPFKPQDPIDLETLNSSIEKAQNYYEGLYQDVGSSGAVVAEYYPKTNYTIRHATIGGYYYYTTTGDLNKAKRLSNVIDSYKFNKYTDEHSFIWQTKPIENTLVSYTPNSYRDCQIKMDVQEGLDPYHSKVCKLGQFGVNLYILATKFDTYLPLVKSLQTVALNNKVDSKTIADFENKYNRLGFGMPMCTPLGCSKVASTIRTASFGELELRLGNMKYADAVAANLVKAQDNDGAIYISYDKKGDLKVKKPLVYKLVDYFLNDKPATNYYIPTNSETMSDALAFLIHYRCQKYGVFCGYLQYNDQ